MCAELRQALAGGRALDEANDFKRFRSRSPSTANLGAQFLFEASDLATEVTPKAKRQNTALVNMKLKELRLSTRRTPFSDQFSKLDDE